VTEQVNLEAVTSPTTIPQPDVPQSSRTAIWTARLSTVIQVLFFIEAGMLLLILPWTSVWMHNSLLAGHNTLQNIVYSGFFRGVASGIGLLNLFNGVQAAVTYSDPVK
jgi:hypothetical protein